MPSHILLHKFCGSSFTRAMDSFSFFADDVWWLGDAPSEVSSPAALNQYALVLTKFRIFQLDRKGLRKVVVMDA